MINKNIIKMHIFDFTIYNIWTHPFVREPLIFIILIPLFMFSF
jgi:hypothetical protein